MNIVNWLKSLFFKLWSKIPREKGKISMEFWAYLFIIAVIIQQIFFGGTGSEGCSWMYDTDC